MSNFRCVQGHGARQKSACPEYCLILCFLSLAADSFPNIAVQIQDNGWASLGHAEGRYWQMNAGKISSVSRPSHRAFFDKKKKLV